jgi:cell fate (sporulation/competence/biofilm development) regulator YlbF (YheA/YmcA/DUF963 family)
MSDTQMELARDIVNLIMESESYLRYKSALEQIISTPEQLEKLISLQNEFGEKRLRGEDDFFLERHVSQNYYKLLLDEDMRDFFKYRKELADTFVSVYNTIADESFVKTLGITLS